ncbi:MAG: hypothetical protein ETSY1_23335 [Candidatus Entotheonella factor]|uniref:Glycosyltransferase 2-like domain-containing protein n=1 Tax=Entotheonella factor TaxID=1429438 RepID=W4LH04_ENTF1|nr:MAG: hypothetical protein ETSY1_23335 [Candidatus Entotheonella factor]
MLRLKIIVNCGPCEAYIGKCLDSIKRQTYPHWEAYVTIDPHGDRTFECAQVEKGGDERITVTQNTDSLYSTANLVRAIDRSQAEPEDVIVTLDGDDWFSSEEVLRIIVRTYTTFDCWLTYGSWVPNFDDGYVGQWPAYPEGITDFRARRYLATQVKTWKKWLWDLIDDRDLRDENGQYFRATGDQAVMFPMLEMSGTHRAKHISDILMIYNRATPYSADKTKYREMKQNEAYIRSKPAYTQLPEKIVRSG